MQTRSHQLAEQLEHATDTFAAYIESLTEDEWMAHCIDEERRVAAVARHVADGIQFELPVFRAIAAGEATAAMPYSALHEYNAAHAREHDTCDRAETIQILRDNTAEAAAFVRSLDDEQLQRSGAYIEEIGAMTLEQWIERVLIGHITRHMRSIQAVRDEIRASA